MTLEIETSARYRETVKNITVSLDDDTYRNARRWAAEHDRSLSSVVREFLQSCGAQESEFDRLARLETEIIARVACEHPEFSSAENVARDELHDRDAARTDDR